MALNILTDEKCEVVVNGVKYQVTIPSLKELSELQKKNKALEETDFADSYQEFFDKLGLPKEASERFSAKHWKLLIEEITGAKKA